eukprot:CAMPEP_0194179328 /NCGR_PEP_ID=MMETSP0154-20130528/12805_1 /TAXON_ID=1049557 /ORGANISM="Thalassiothrix antarctica, Strain L6-D1" /LENGTH=380 /DNA_ID=CAMNT_0038894647 /DNA_START=105 /DNA_END=1243 /DNA_ORIENTATION=+
MATTIYRIRRLAFRRNYIYFLLRLLVTAALFFGDCEYSGSFFALAFHGSNPTAIGRPHSILQTFQDKYSRTLPTRKRTTATQLEALPSLSGEEESLLFWITAFASSHIGMSAIRQNLITDVFGRFLANDLLGIVGTGKLRLPNFWPGDSSGTNELFPDIETTGRQFYRIFYTMVSFLTLGMAFSIYLALRNSSEEITLQRSIDVLNAFGNSSSGGEVKIILSYAVATLAGAFSLASLVNASPLGLMPSFRQKNDDDGASVPTGGGTMVPTTAGDTLLGITRDDALKFDPKGLTRITRHPLILPVVPWGVATSVLVGGQPSDAILFGGLSLYAIAGCYCQDLRVLREEGSVGTVFFSSNNGDEDTNTDTATKTMINQKLRS